MPVPVLTAVSDAVWEAQLVVALERADLGVAVVRRCVDLADLLATASTGQARAVLLSADLRRLDRASLARLAVSGVAVVGLAPPGDEEAERRLRALGVRVGAQFAAGLLRAVAAPPRDPVRIQALGGFRVLRAGEPVPVEDWQSRKARELLKVLVARRGRAVPREALMEALWPDEDPARLSNRLSVALSTVRLSLIHI